MTLLVRLRNLVAFWASFFFLIATVYCFWTANDTGLKLIWIAVVFLVLRFVLSVLVQALKEHEAEKLHKKIVERFGQEI